MIDKNLLTCHWLHSSISFCRAEVLGLTVHQDNWHPTLCFWEAACGQTETASVSRGRLLMYAKFFHLYTSQTEGCHGVITKEFKFKELS